MKVKLTMILIAIITICCEKKKDDTQMVVPIAGTWKLISGTTIEKEDTVFTDYTGDRNMIKIINSTHFSFLDHDLNKGRDSTAVFSAGGGRYTLAGDQYTEYLDYCSHREWEGNKFQFTVTVQNDTLTQSGIEVVESAGVNRLNIEKYTRVKE